MSDNITHCPCCGEEFNEEDVKIAMCIDCNIGTVDGAKPSNFDNICQCEYDK